MSDDDAPDIERLYSDRNMLQEYRRAVMFTQQLAGTVSPWTPSLERDAGVLYWCSVVVAATIGAAFILTVHPIANGIGSLFHEIGSGLLTASAIGAVWQALDTRGRHQRSELQNLLMGKIEMIDLTTALLYLEATSEKRENPVPGGDEAGP